MCLCNITTWLVDVENNQNDFFILRLFLRPTLATSPSQRARWRLAVRRGAAKALVYVGGAISLTILSINDSSTVYRGADPLMRARILSRRAERCAARRGSRPVVREA